MTKWHILIMTIHKNKMFRLWQYLQAVGLRAAGFLQVFFVCLFVFCLLQPLF